MSVVQAKQGEVAQPSQLVVKQVSRVCEITPASSPAAFEHFAKKLTFETDRRSQSEHSAKAHLTLPAFSQPPPAAYDLALERRPQPPSATLQIIRTPSTLYKTHRLPRGAASFKSLYPKRHWPGRHPTGLPRALPRDPQLAR
jgi:hypothetical protein